MSKVILECGGRTCCPTINSINGSSEDFFIIKDDFGGSVKLDTKQILQIPKKMKELQKLQRLEDKKKIPCI